MSASRTAIGLVFGGASGEHNVSIKSAINVVHAFKSGANSNQFELVLFYLDKEGRWWPAEIAEIALHKGLALSQEELPSPIPPSGFSSLPKGSEKVQIWFPVLHGPNGEDGTIQGLFKLTNKPFVGSGVLGSALGMDKLAMKAAFSAAGLPQVSYLSADSTKLSEPNYLKALTEQLKIEIGFPCFVKPANLGSSVGITKALNQEQFLKGLAKAGKLDKRIILEKAVLARELECAVLGGKNLQASDVGEILFDADWYDYETKYSQGSSKMLIPAPLPKVVSEKIRVLTLQACKAVGAIGMARVDFFYDEKDNNLWINEINTLPGFTSQSMYPALWEEAGVTLDQLVAKLVETARE